MQSLPQHGRKRGHGLGAARWEVAQAYGVACLVGGGASQKASVVRRGSAYGEEVQLFVSYGPVELFVSYGPVELFVSYGPVELFVSYGPGEEGVPLCQGGDQERR